MANQDRIDNSDEQFGQTCLRYLEGDLTADELQQFEAAIAQDAAKGRLLIELSMQAAFVEELDILQEDATQSAEKRAHARKPARKAICDSPEQTPLTRAYCFFARPTPFSLTVAAAVMGLLVTAMALMVPPFYRAMTRTDDDVQSGKYDIVAEVSGKYEVEWVESNDSLHHGAFLISGRELRLEKGILEITYRDGVIVRLEGPCEYIVEDLGHGELKLGRLLANVPREAVGFRITTPAGVITDLGTEFGVDVGTDLAADVGVLVGKIEYQPGDHHNAPGEPLILTKGQAVTIGRDGSVTHRSRVELEVALAKLKRLSAMSSLQRAQLALAATGRNLAEGTPDANWEVAITGRDGSEFAPAIVTPAHPDWLANTPATSGWLSVVSTPEDVPGASYTFRTRFDLTGHSPKSAMIVGRVACDDGLDAIRLNGHPVDLPANSTGFRQFEPFRISQHFIEGVNVLELVVNNQSDSPMGLRVELTGYAFPIIDSPSPAPESIRQE